MQKRKSERKNVNDQPWRVGWILWSNWLVFVGENKTMCIENRIASIMNALFLFLFLLFFVQMSSSCIHSQTHIHKPRIIEHTQAERFKKVLFIYTQKRKKNLISIKSLLYNNDVLNLLCVRNIDAYIVMMIITMCISIYSIQSVRQFVEKANNK